MNLQHKSYLVIDRDIEGLRAHAKEFSKNFNPADVFWLTNTKTPAANAAPPLQKGDTSTIKVEETLAFMEKAHLAPVGERKLFIICDASTMTVAAQNKILKTVEDAPAHTTFLLLATNAEQILNTIKSRCVTVYATTPSALRASTPSKEGEHYAEIIPPEVAATLKKIFGKEIDESKLTPEQRYKILTTLAKINRNIAANCNAQNQMDLLLLNLVECGKLGHAKNS